MSTTDEWVQGPAARTCARRRRAGFAKQARRLGRRSRGARRLSRRDRSGPGRCATRSPSDVDAIVRGLAFGKSMLWDDSGLRFPRPVRWLLRASSTRRRSRSTSRGFPRQASTYGHRFTHGEVEGRRAPTTTRRRCAAAGVEPEQAEREQTIREGLAALGGAPNPRELGEVVHLVEMADRPRGTLRRAVPRAARARGRRPRCSRTSATSRSAATGSRSSRTAAIPSSSGAGNERVLAGRLEDATFTFERDVAERRSRRWPAKLGLDHVRRRRGHVRRQDRAAHGARATSSAAATRRARRPGSRRPTRPPSSCASSPTSRATSAPSTRAWRDSRTRCAWRSRSSTCPTPPTARCPHTEAGRVLAAADKIDSLTVAFALGKRPTGSRDPFGLRRAAIGLLPPGGRGRARDRREGPRRPRPRAPHGQNAAVKDDPSDVWDFVVERLEGLLDVPVEFVRAPAQSALASSARSPASPAGARGRGRDGGVRRGLHRVRPREPPRRRADGAAGTARSRARDRRRPRSCAVERLSAPARAIDAAVAEGDFARRSPRPRRSAPPVDALLRRRARHGRGRGDPREPAAAPPGRARRGRGARRPVADPSVRLCT